MKLVELTTLSSGVSKQDLVTLAVNGVTTYTGSDAVCPVTREATDSTLTTTIGGDSEPIVTFTPRYLARAKQGCKAAVICTEANADSVKGEFESYSFIKIDSTHQLIWGICNYDQIDDGYTPVGPSQITFAYWV